MERRLRYTLLTDGSSDRSLIHIIDWSIEQQPGNWLPEGTWADRYRFADVGHDLAERAAFAWEQYPTDLLIIHRDAEKEEAAVRRAEIERAMQVHPNIPHLPLVIKPMLEAWLLGDEQAIRVASGNPNGKGKLALPGAKKWESLPDPKHLLEEQIKIASGRRKRALKKLHLPHAKLLVAENTENFQHLRQLEAFRWWEQALVKWLEQKG